MCKFVKSPAEIPEISGLSLFSGLSETELRTVSEYLFSVNLKKGESIFREGDKGEEMFVHFSGVLSAYGAHSDGNERHLFDVKPGDFFGEMSIITHIPRTVTITASSDSVVILLGKNDFYRIISQHPIIGFKLLRTIGVVQNRWINTAGKSYNDLIRWGENARRRAITDELTGIYNRSFLEDSIKERLNNQLMNLRVMSMLMMDLDKIHGINDRYGTKAGDLVIMAAAEIINSCMREGDIPARLSGDEFAILLPDTDKENAEKVAEKIRENIEKKQIEVTAKDNEKTVISTRTSIGIALSPLHAKTAEELIEASDKALRKAKDMGRNRVEVYGE